MEEERKGRGKCGLSEERKTGGREDEGKTRRVEEKKGGREREKDRKREEEKK